MADERRTHQADRGQAVMLLLAVVALIAMALVGLSAAGEHLVDQARTQAAADAAALAGATGGRQAAAQLAARNGASLVDFAITAVSSDGVDVSVTVAVGAAHATAHASTSP